MMVVVLCMTAILLIPSNGYAEDSKTTMTPKTEKVAGIELKGKRWDSSQYIANVSTEDAGMIDSKLIAGATAITNFFFSITKIVGEVIDTGIGYLYSLNAIDLLADKVAKISKALWDNLYASFGVMFFIIAVLHIFFIFSAKRNSQEALRRTFVLFCVIGISVLWFSNASFLLKTMNKLSNETQGIVMKAGTEFTSGSDEKIQKGQELEGSLAIMRNAYFELVVEKPYLIMNYGTPDRDVILEKDKNRIDNLLKYKMTTAGVKERDKIISKDIETYDNTAMTSSTSNVANQMGVALISAIFSIVLGVPLILIAFLNLLFSILAMLLMLLLAVSVLLAILPMFANSAWNTLGKLIATFFMKALIGLVILFVFLIITIIEAIIPSTNVGLYFLNCVAVAVCIIFLILYRNELISSITGGQVRSIGNVANKAGKKFGSRRRNKRKKSFVEDDGDDDGDIDDGEPLNDDDTMTFEDYEGEGLSAWHDMQDRKKQPVYEDVPIDDADVDYEITAWDDELNRTTQDTPENQVSEVESVPSANNSDEVKSVSSRDNLNAVNSNDGIQNEFESEDIKDVRTRDDYDQYSENAGAMNEDTAVLESPNDENVLDSAYEPKGNVIDLNDYADARSEREPQIYVEDEPRFVDDGLEEVAFDSVDALNQLDIENEAQDKPTMELTPDREERHVNEYEA